MGFEAVVESPQARKNIPNDQNRSQWILPNLRSKELVRECHIQWRLILREFDQVVAHENDVVHAPSDFCEIGFEVGFT
jgi:hypothetical protein